MQHPHKWRTVRVYVSSTFDDFHSERDYLVQYIFPRLRKQLEPYQIDLVDVDLRWGATRDEVEDYRSLELCLNKIDKGNSKDCDGMSVFMGLLGERYGYVPEKFMRSFPKHYRWVEDYPGYSINALEITHAALQGPSKTANCCFYFRDPAFIADVPEEMRPYVQEEDESRADKLAQLKTAIREAKLPVMDGYPCEYGGIKVHPEFIEHELGFIRFQKGDKQGAEALSDIPDDILRVLPDGAQKRLLTLQSITEDDMKTVMQRSSSVKVKGLETFGDRVFTDLIDAISVRHPEIKKKTSKTEEGAVDNLKLTQEMHESFGAARLDIFEGRQNELDQMAAYVAGDESRPLVVTGLDGCGKSALMARFYQQGAEKDTYILPHFIGATANSKRLDGTLRRLCLTLKQVFDIPVQIPLHNAELPQTLRIALGMVPSDKKVVVLIDALDRLEGKPSTDWLPEDLPANAKMIVSCQDDESKGSVYAELHRKNFSELEIEPLETEDILRIIASLPSLAVRTLVNGQVMMMLTNPMMSNPLFLRTVTEELRGSGPLGRRNRRLLLLHDVNDLNGLFVQVLERLEMRYGHMLVRKMMCLIAASRLGLAESDLEALLQDMTSSETLRMMLRDMRPYLTHHWGLLGFRDMAMVQAVRKRYQNGTDDAEWHHTLAQYFLEKRLGQAVPQPELLWQFAQEKLWKALYLLLTNEEHFNRFWKLDPNEVLYFWEQLEAHSEYRINGAYQKITMAPYRYPLELIENLTTFFHYTEHPELAFGLQRHHVDAYRKLDNSDKKNQLQKAIGRLADLNRNEKMWDEAVSLYEKQARLCRESDNEPNLAESIYNQAQVFKEQGKTERAMELFHEAEKIWCSLGDKAGQRRCFAEQASILYSLGKIDSASVLCELDQQICEGLGDKVHLCRALRFQGILYLDLKLPNDALELFKRSERLSRELGSADDLQMSLRDQAQTLIELDQLEPAMKLLKEQEPICQKINLKRSLALCLERQAFILKKWREPEEALDLAKRAEGIFRELVDKTGLQRGLAIQAMILAEQGEWETAMKLEKEAETICQSIGDAEGLKRSQTHQGILLYENGQKDAGRELLREVAPLVLMQREGQTILERVRDNVGK